MILNRLLGGDAADTGDLSPLTYLLESGSDRIGALDFQPSADAYVPRSQGDAQLPSSPPWLHPRSGSRKASRSRPRSTGASARHLGRWARPKALLKDGTATLIAKFSSTTDTFAVVKAEFVAMELARRAGSMSPGRAHRGDGRTHCSSSASTARHRRAPRPVSALTILGLDEWGGRYASYEALADEIRERFTQPRATLRELFSRLTLNILLGNTDDHARNHAAFWDGAELTLTPAYDICPLPRTGGEASQAMAIGRDGYRLSQVAGCVERASTYLLTEAEAREIVDRQIETIETAWEDVCDLAGLSEVDRELLRRGAFLTRYSLEGYHKAR